MNNHPIQAVSAVEASRAPANARSLRPRAHRIGALPVLLSCCLVATSAWGAVSPKRQQELIYLLRHDCGSCHGMTLRGGLGPALLPETLAAKPAATLEATVLYGRLGTPMPPWRGLLSEAEVKWLIQRLQEGIPDVR